MKLPLLLFLSYSCYFLSLMHECSSQHPVFRHSHYMYIPPLGVREQVSHPYKTLAAAEWHPCVFFISMQIIFRLRRIWEDNIKMNFK
jgi:hypothetical protein